ncbi:MAG: DHH family phosphoesterase [Armatimonadetes bacterium]|nr:DHH family phosphoesterase [Armatimonadota bacterium]MDE2206579.1 DHH family phosphoesterase [Armatimonadota bacterium]
MASALQRAVAAILASRSVVLATHTNPDGDAIGSILGLAHALTGLGIIALPLSSDGVPDIYSWMPGASTVQSRTLQRHFDVALVCDAGKLERIGGPVMPAVRSAKTTIDIDHHVADGVFGDIRLVDAKSASTAEVAWRLIVALERASGRLLRSRAIAECLMTGIITDTGGFRYPAVEPRTFRLAAILQSLGAHPAPICERVFEDRTPGSLKLLGRALSDIQSTPDGSVVWAAVRRSDFTDLNASDADTEGIVTVVRSTRGATIGILFRELSGGSIRVSLRAREGADVNAVAKAFGGGGHHLAAGCTLDAPLEAAVAAVVEEAHRQLRGLQTG